MEVLTLIYSFFKSLKIKTGAVACGYFPCFHCLFLAIHSSNGCKNHHFYREIVEC